MEVWRPDIQGLGGSAAGDRGCHGRSPECDLRAVSGGAGLLLSGGTGGISSKGSLGARRGTRDTTLTGENVRLLRPLAKALDASSPARYTGSQAVGCCRIASRSWRVTTRPKLCMVNIDMITPDERTRSFFPADALRDTYNSAQSTQSNPEIADH